MSDILKNGTCILQFVHRTMPSATEAELRIAVVNLRRYLALVLKVHKRIKSNNE